MEIAPCDSPRAGRRVRAALARRVNSGAGRACRSRERLDPLAVGLGDDLEAHADLEEAGLRLRRWRLAPGDAPARLDRLVRRPAARAARATGSPTGSGAAQVQADAARREIRRVRALRLAVARRSTSTGERHGEIVGGLRRARRLPAGSAAAPRAPARARGAARARGSRRGARVDPECVEDAMQDLRIGPRVGARRASALGASCAASRRRRARCARRAQLIGASGAGSRGVARTKVETTRGTGKKQLGGRSRTRSTRTAERVEHGERAVVARVRAARPAAPRPRAAPSPTSPRARSRRSSSRRSSGDETA